MSGDRISYEFGAFSLDPGARALTKDGVAVAMAGKAFDVLVLLVERAGELVPRGALLAALWPGLVVEDNNLNQAILGARRAIGDGRDGQRYIVTVPGRGYQFVAAVRARHSGEPSPAPIERAAEPPAVRERSPELRTLRGRRLALAAAAAIAAAAASVYALSGGGSGGERDADALGAVARVSPVTTFLGDEISPSISPDGAFVAFAWDGGGERARGIYTLRIGGQEAMPLTSGADGPDRDPAWSPDGTRIAFLRQRSTTNFDVYVSPALGGAERFLLSTRVKLISHEGAPRVAWAPDGRSLLLTDEVPSDGDDASYAIAALDVATGAVRRLTYAPHSFDTSPAMSPDGKWLAFTRYDLSRRVPTLLVQRLGADGAPHGAPAPVPGVPAGIVLSPTWSPNSRHLVFVRGQQVFDWQVGRSARLVYTANGSLGQMSMTWKNGRARAVATKADPNPDIFDVALDPATHAALGPPRRTVESTALEQHPQFSPDGRELAFMSRRSGHDAIWLAAADGGSPRQLTFLEAEVLGYPAWSPDGRRVAFHASTPGQRRTMYVTDAGGGIERRLFEGCCASWSHDGEYLYVTEVAEAGKANAVSRVRVADGARERLAVGDLAIETADGTRLLYSKEFERGLFARSLQGDVASNAEEKLVDDYIPMLGGFAAVDDGVFYLSHTEQGLPRAFSFYDFRSRAARDVLPAPASVWFGLTVSPDLEHLLYASGSPESGTDLVLFEFE